MSEYLNTLGNPVLQEDVSSRSLHVSDLSPTSELLLSPRHFHTDRAHHIRKSYENDTVSPMEFHFKRPDFNSTNGTTRVNPARQYNDLQTTDDPDTIEKPRKAFSHERLYPKRHKPSTTANGQPRTCYPKQDGTYHSFGREIPGTLLNSTSFTNTKPSSSSVKLDKTLQCYSSQSSDAKNNHPYTLSEARYSSLISKNNFNGGREKDGDVDDMVPRDQTSRSKFSYMFDGEYTGKMVDGEFTGKIVDGEYTGKMFDGGYTGKMVDGDSAGKMVDGESTGKIFDGEFTGEMFDGGTWGLSYGTLDENELNGHGYTSATLNGVPKDNGGFNVVPSKNRDGKSHGVTFDGDQRYDGVISNGMNGGMTSKRSGDLRSSGMVNGRTLDGTTGHGYRSVLSNGHINGAEYGEFYSDGVNGNHGLTLANNGDLSESKTPSGLFEAATETTESILSRIFGRNNASRKERMTSLGASNGARGTSGKPVDLGSNHNRTVVSKDLSYNDPLVQTNVVHYYDKLRKPGGGETLGERGRDVSALVNSEMVSGTRRGMRSKSSELPLSGNTSVSTSHGLSKSWGSSKTRQEFEAIRVIKMEDGARENSETLSQRQRVAKMFRIEEETALRRAQEFQRGTLLRKLFTAWHVRTRGVKISVDQLWKTHLLRKGMNGLKYAVERQGRAVVEFQEKNGRIVLRKCWQMWQHQTRENQRKKVQDTFTQWHYYKLHMEREKLLETIANKHILSKNYLKWKTVFNSKQKNSIATVHFKINLIYKYWQCWILYNNQRRVKNHMKSIACYRYGERTRRRLFKEWKDRTEKSLLSKRLARRRVLLKAFFYWKHWTQYAKIVHLRLQNMCKEYHKRCLMTRTFVKWRRALRVKQSIAFWKKNQLRRTLKLWKLRLMRKKIHKHLCKALAKKAKKRRFFEKWIHFIQVKKQTRSVFAKRLQDFHVRTLFNCWRKQVIKETEMRKSVCTFQDESSRRLICQSWESWRFQSKLLELRKRSKKKWSLGCVRKCCEVWKLKIRKQKLGIQLQENRSVCEVLVVKRFFRIWREEHKKVRVDYSRSLYVATILKKNSLARIFQAWRVVNQEECIIESLVRRRERKEMARVYDAWRHFLFRETYIRRRQNLRIELVKRKTFEIWRHKLWSITKAQEVKQALVYSKLKRNFLAWMDYVKDVRFAEKMREQKSADMMRNFIQKWKQTAERKVETRDREKGEKAYRRVLLVSFFAAWQRKTKEHVQRVTSLLNMADTNRKQNIVDRSLKRWMRQYRIEIKTREYLQFKSTERLRIIFLTWKDFANDEFERQVYDFATNLALDSSSGSMLLSTSGYQTSLKNSTASFQFLPGEEEAFVSVLSPRFRPLTPTRSLDDSQENAKPVLVLPSYRPVTTDRQQLFPGYQTPPLTNGPQSSCCRFPLTNQDSIDQLSQAGTSPQRSSEDDDGVPSSGVHSAGEESDQDDRTSIHVPESLCSFQTTSDGLPRDRELLVAETIIHWRSLSLSVAFRSWYKYTHHVTLVRTLFADCVASKRRILLTKMIGKWRRWLFVTVLARQHLVMHLQKKYLIVWVSYRQRRILNEERKEEAATFSKKLFLQRFFVKWKNKKTTKCQLQSIVGRWQKNAVVTDVEKVIIQQFQEREQAIYLRQTFLYWKKMTRSFQQASHFCQSLLLRRCLNNWRDAASYRAELKKKVNSFTNSHLIAKTFKEWVSRYEDNRTAKILLGASEERKTEKTFKAWRTWASASSFLRKTSLAYRRAQEHNKLKAKFRFWFSSANKRIAMKDHYNKSLQRRILKSWRNVLTTKASTSGSIQDFQKIVQRNALQTWFMFWRRRAQHNQLLSEYLKQQTKRKLTSAFGRWRQQKRKSEAGAHYSQRLKKKMFTSWCQEISKRKKARQHFKYWHTIAEGTKELNQVADIIVQDSESKLLRVKFLFWKKSTRHAQVAKYHHSTKLSRRFFIGWHDYTSNHKRLSLTFKEFQASHQRSNSGLLGKYMKIWKMKSTFSKQAEQLSNYNMSSKYWKVWRHNFVRRRVSSAMVEHDNKKILSKVFISWYNITSSHKQLTKEVESFRTQRWFRHWMARYNNS